MTHAARPLTALLCAAALTLGACADTGVSLPRDLVVAGLGDQPFLNMRAGPGLGFAVILGLPEGTPLSRTTCVTEVGQLWCEVRSGGQTGWVSADYLAPG